MAAQPQQQDYSKAIIGAILAGVVGLAFVGSQQAQKNEQNNIDDLPAIEARLQAVEAITKTNQAAIKGTLNAETLNASLEAINARITALDGQIGRRFQLEVKDPIYRELDRIQGDFTAFRDHMNTPPNSHHRGGND